MSSSIATLLRRQHGVIHREQARRCGLSDDRIDRLTRRGAWIRLAPRVYLAGSAPHTWRAWAVAASPGNHPVQVRGGRTITVDLALMRGPRGRRRLSCECRSWTPSVRGSQHHGTLADVPWDIVIAVVGGLVLLWVALVVVFWVAKPDDATMGDALRLLPDVVRLVSRLARDPEVPRRVRVALFVLLGYLVSPLDIVPDVIPVVGYLDDAVIVALTLRWVARHAGYVALERHWPGTPEGLDAVRRVARISDGRNGA